MGRRGGKGVWRWGRGRLYTYHYAVTTRMTPALRWAEMRAILMFHNCEGQSHKTVSTDHNLWSERRRAKVDSNWGPSAYHPTALPLGQTGSPQPQAKWLPCEHASWLQQTRWQSHSQINSSPVRNSHPNQKSLPVTSVSPSSSRTAFYL